MKKQGKAHLSQQPQDIAEVVPHLTFNDPFFPG
jgi:hypothetical protein